MPRTFRHWTPRYVVNRLALIYHQRRSPRAPWLTKRAYEFLDDWLTRSDVGLEWGSGRSTLWFASRVRMLTSIEHDPAWYDRVAAELKVRGLTHVDYHLAPIETTPGGEECPYTQIGRDLAPESLDFVLVDGQLRERCAGIALARLKPGGLLIVDNAEWYIPHTSIAPGAIARAGAAPSPRWRRIIEKLQAWRCFWTTNGIWDTAIFTKPPRRS